jgi:hypothetical protein
MNEKREMKWWRRLLAFGLSERRSGKKGAVGFALLICAVDIMLTYISSSSPRSMPSLSQGKDQFTRTTKQSQRPSNNTINKKAWPYTYVPVQPLWGMYSRWTFSGRCNLAKGFGHASAREPPDNRMIFLSTRHLASVHGCGYHCPGN